MTVRRLTLYCPSLPPSGETVPASELSCDFHISGQPWRCGTLQQAAAAFEEAGTEDQGSGTKGPAPEVVVYLSSTAALTTTVSAPPKQHKHLATILPFLCEEQLATDIEQLHIVAGQIQGEQISISAIDKATLTQITQLCAQSGLPVNGIFSELELLRGLLQPRENLLWMDHHQCCLVINQQGLAVDIEQSAYALALIQQQPSETLLFFHVGDNTTGENNSGETKSTAVTLALEGMKSRGTTILEYELAPDNSNLLQQLAHLNLLDETRPPSANLLSGQFAPRSPASAHNHWKPAAIAAGSVIGLGILYLLISGVYFSIQASALQQQSKALYHQYFPNDKRLVNIRQQALTHLKQTASRSDDGFLSLLNQVKTPWSAHHQQLHLKSLRFNQPRNELILDIESRTIEQLDQLQLGLGKHAELLSANEDKGGVRGRIKLQGGMP